MAMYPQQSNQAGFTLIELMISSAIFIVITVTGVSVLLNATNNYRTTSEIRQSMDTISFAMEDMARTIRLGTVFHCGDFMSVDVFHSCAVNTGTYPGLLGGSLLSLEAFGGNTANTDDQVMYWVFSPSGDLKKGVLYKKTQSRLGTQSTPGPDAALFSQITPDNVYLDILQSGFSVSEAGSLYATPVVTIRLSGEVKYRATTVPFDIQTSIAPRNIPNPPIQ